MKKILLTLAVLISGFVSMAQSDESTVYKIFRTEFYIYNDRSEKWDLETRIDDVNIDMVSYKNVINIQAKTPTLFRIYKETEKNLEGKDYFGVRVDALECVNMNNCTIDLIRLTKNDSKVFVLSVILNDKTLGKINLRYYSTID